MKFGPDSGKLYTEDSTTLLCRTACGILMATPGCLCTFKPPITTNQKPFSVHAVEQYGLPSRVRCDRGGENVLVSNFILINPEREPGQGSCRTGRCVHNQRIERLWRDVHTECISLFYDLFYMLEDEKMLYACNIVDL